MKLIQYAKIIRFIWIWIPLQKFESHTVCGLCIESLWYLNQNHGHLLVKHIMSSAYANLVVGTSL